MFVIDGIVKLLGDLVKKAEHKIIEEIKNGEVEDEPSITNRFIERTKTYLEESEGKLVKHNLHIRTLLDRGPKAPEREFGADICGVLDVELDDYYTNSKGFLAQAKCESEYVKVDMAPRGIIRVNFNPSREFNRLKEQVNRMLEITPDSFVFIYSTKGFVVVPASSVRGLSSETGGVVYGKPIANFFKEFLMCFIGDHRLTATDNETLRELRERTLSRIACMFKIVSF